MKSMIGCALLIFALGCAKSESNNGNPSSGLDTPEMKAEHEKCQNSPRNSSTDIRYIFSQSNNGTACTTKCQIFNSTEEYCRGLQDNELNNNCALEKRQQAYQESCKK